MGTKGVANLEGEYRKTLKIQLQDVSFRYTHSFQPNSDWVLRHISLTIEQGDFIGIVGPSGSGKTTLIQLFNALLRPVEGQILVDEVPIQNYAREITKIRQRIGIVFQFPETQFFENTVYDEIAYGLRNLKIPESEIEQQIREKLALVDLDYAIFRNRSPFRLSDGEKRRVAIASILVMEPKVLVLDEPTAGLDYRSIILLKQVIRRIFQQEKTIVIVSHDMDFVGALVHRIVALQRGQICFDGPKTEFFKNMALVNSTHLKLPRAFEMAVRLQKKGIPLVLPIYELEDLQHQLRELAAPL